MAILIVDDENELASLIKEDLEASGYTNIDTASNGQEAFNKCVSKISSSDPYKLIVSDWDMPVMNGIQFLEKVRRNTHLSEIPFILITGVGTAEAIKMASRHGVSAILLKPFDKGVLLDKIKTILPAEALSASSQAN